MKGFFTAGGSAFMECAGDTFSAGHGGGSRLAKRCRRLSKRLDLVVRNVYVLYLWLWMLS